MAVVTPVGPTGKIIEGETVLFTNFATPINKTVFWVSIIAFALLLLLLIFLFTSPMTRGKARALFFVTYVMTFVSLAIPLLVVVMSSQNTYLLELFDRAPVGLVQGKTKALSEPQWLVNIGGLVISSNAPAISTTMSSTIFEGTTTSVVGGIVIPFYVVMLAMIAAGVNLTRKVPIIQQQYALELRETGRSMKEAVLAGLAFKFSAPEEDDNLSDGEAEKRATAAAEIRKEIISSYMALLSAPFLAIAVYYLLQIIATNVAEPVLVVMAFSTGLVSEAVILWIIDFAEGYIKEQKPTAARQTITLPAQPKPVQPSTPALAPIPIQAPPTPGTPPK